MTILVLQLRRLGDVLMTTPVLRAIKHAQPGSVVHYCVEPGSAPAVCSNPHVDNLVIAERGSSLGLGIRLRRRRYDAVVDTLGTPGSARLALLSAAPVRIGRARRWRTACYTHPIPLARTPRYSAAEKLELLEPLGIRSDDCRIELFPTEADRLEAAHAWAALGLSDRDAVAAFSPVSRRTAKVWPAERFAQVCDRWFIRTGLRFLPFFAPGEEEQVECVIRRLRYRDAVIYPRRAVSFGALLPLMQRCALYFGNDNGLRHVAVAAGLPSAAVFGPSNPVAWTPPGSGSHLCAGGLRAIEAVGVEEADAVLASVAAIAGLGPPRSGVREGEPREVR
jgi:ADP-heptose:LPS heptosyltransferase